MSSQLEARKKQKLVVQKKEKKILTYLISSSAGDVTESLQHLFRYHPLSMD